MRKTRVSAALVFIMAFALFFAGASSAQVTRWKGQACFPLSVAPYGPFGKGQTGMAGHHLMWTEWLKNASGGRLLIDWSDPGAIFPPTEGDTATAKNVVQISANYGSLYAGRIPETDVETGGVFIWENEEQVFEALHKYGLYQALQNIYAKHNIKWLPAHSDAIVGIGTTFPAPNPGSMKGKKIRAVGMWADYVRMLGASPVSTPYGEIYMAMKLGTVDGWVAGAAALEDLKLKEVTKGFVYSPMIATAFGNVTVNMDAFNKLPKDIQQLLDRDTPYVMYALSSNWHNQCTWVLRNAQQQYGLKLYAWSPEDADRLTLQAAKEIYPRIASKSKGCAELLEIVKKQMRDHGRLK